MMTTTDELDVLGLREKRQRSVIRFGSIDVGFAVVAGSVHQGLNVRATADVELRYSLTAGQPVDYFSQLVVGHHRPERDRIHFTGAVTEAVPVGDIAKISALAVAELSERQVGFFEGQNTVAPEIMHLMARTGGLPEERVHVEGLDAMLPTEAIEVIAPVHGLEVAETVRLGGVMLIPHARGAATVEEFAGRDAVAEFRDAGCYAVVTDVGKRMFDVEVKALSEIDAGLAWLAVRARYGLALMPSGEPQHFRRQTALSRPERGRLVLVRAIGSGRRWLRSALGSDVPAPLPLDAERDRTWRLPKGFIPTLQDRQALLACARAARGLDQLERVQALWEALEFYVSGVAPEKRFEKAEVKRIRRAMPADIDPELRKRALHLLEKINDPPLMARLRETVRRDGVPLADGELSLLRELRDARNDAVHGRTPDLPAREDVDHAVSVVSRMLLYRLSRG
jgi:hypothetical protein